MVYLFQWKRIIIADYEVEGILPAKYTQHKIEYKKWAYDDHAYKVYPWPAVAFCIIYLKVTQKIK